MHAARFFLAREAALASSHRSRVISKSAALGFASRLDLRGNLWRDRDQQFDGERHGPVRSANKTWHRELCVACGVDPMQLDSIRESPKSELFNPIGDGAAGNLGSGADAGGRIAINIGTSAAVR